MDPKKIILYLGCLLRGRLLNYTPSLKRWRPQGFACEEFLVDLFHDYWTECDDNGCCGHKKMPNAIISHVIYQRGSCVYLHVFSLFLQALIVIFGDSCV